MEIAVNSFMSCQLRNNVLQEAIAKNQLLVAKHLELEQVVSIKMEI